MTPRTFETICAVLESIPGFEFAIFFDIQEDARALVRCGVIVVGGVSLGQVVETLGIAGLGEAVCANCLAMSPVEFCRRLQERDPYIAEVMDSRARRVHPALVEQALDTLSTACRLVADTDAKRHSTTNAETMESLDGYPYAHVATPSP